MIQQLLYSFNVVISHETVDSHHIKHGEFTDCSLKCHIQSYDEPPTMSKKMFFEATTLEVRGPRRALDFKKRDSDFKNVTVISEKT